MFHRYSAMWSGPDRGSVGHHTSAAKGQISIDHREISVSTATWCRVKGWPKHPEENGTDQGENVGMVFAA